MDRITGTYPLAEDRGSRRTLRLDENDELHWHQGKIQRYSVYIQHNVRTGLALNP